MELVELFAREVKEIAGSLPKTQTSPGQRGCRFGEKTFIGHIYREFDRQYYMRREQFDELLVKANRLGLLQLSRADLVSVMSMEDVRESSVRYLNAEFHFLLA